MVAVVRKRLSHALRSAHSVAIHSEKSDATKARCPGRCQEAHRPHSDAYRLDRLVRASSAPWNLRPSARVPWRSSLAASQTDGTGGRHDEPAEVRNDDAGRHMPVVERDRLIGCLSNTRESFTMRRLHEHEPSGHSFITGNLVHLSKRFPPRKAAPGPYEVVAQLPKRNGQFEYRIKSGCEPFYRTVTENELESLT